MRDHRKLALVFIIGVSVALRVGAAFAMGDVVVNLPGTADQVSYHNLALRVLNGHGFTFDRMWWPYTQAGAPTAHWSYLYTGYLVGIYALFGPHPLLARIIQAILIGILHPLLAYFVGKTVFGSGKLAGNPQHLGQAVGLLSAALTAVYTYFAYYSATLMTESFYIAAILASIYLAMRLVGIGVQEPAGDRLESGKAAWTDLGLAVALGLTLGLAALLRQLYLLFIPFLYGWVLLHGRKHLWKLVVSGVVILIMILPFTLFNSARFGRFVLLNSNAGFAFFWANHPVYGTRFEPILPSSMGSYQSLIPEELRGLDEAALDQELLKRGIQFVIDDPGRYILLSLSRIPPYFKFWPSGDSELLSNIARVTSFGLFWPFMLYGILVSLIRKPAPLTIRPPSPIWLLLMFTVVYTMIHVLTWTLIRYRLPVDAVLILFASLAIIDLAQRVPALNRLATKAEGWLQSA